MATSKTSKAKPAPQPAPAAPTPAPSGPLTFDRYQRWRLILGKRVEDQMSSGRCQSGAGAKGEATLSREMGEMDGALGAIYDIEDSQPEERGQRSASLGS